MLSIEQFNALSDREKAQRLTAQQTKYRAEFWLDQGVEVIDSPPVTEYRVEPKPKPVRRRKFVASQPSNLSDLYERIQARIQQDAGPCINPLQFRDAPVPNEPKPTPDTDDAYEAQAVSKYTRLLEEAEALFSQYFTPEPFSWRTWQDVFTVDIEWASEPFVVPKTDVALALWEKLRVQYPLASNKRLRVSVGKAMDRLLFATSRLNGRWAEVWFETRLAYGYTLQITMPEESDVRTSQAACEWLHRCDVSDEDVKQYLVDPTADLSPEEIAEREADKAEWFAKQLAFRKTQLHKRLQAFFGKRQYAAERMHWWTPDASQAKGVRKVEGTVLEWIAARIEEKGSELAGISSAAATMKNRLKAREKHTGAKVVLPTASRLAVETVEPKIVTPDEYAALQSRRWRKS